MGINETYRLSKPARDGVTAAVDALHKLGLPHLAGVIYPVCHPEWPSSEQDALERLETLRYLLKAKPVVLAQVDPLLLTAEARLRYDILQQEVA